MAKRILIADDSVTIQKAFAMTFAGEDVSIAAARSADEGLALARQARPDLIIADGAMPGRTGYDLCTQVRADAGLRGVPVYILTSSQQPYDEARGRSAGADGHLLKPWDTAVFLEKVYAAAGGASASAPASPAARPPASLPASAMEEEDYGEISIDSSGPATPPPVVTGPPPAAAPSSRVTGAGLQPV
ncbi:MAG TPA: response regulator, partial [Polyangia bacterium]|nr:response regulator [Polyangia bacterium]